MTDEAMTTSWPLVMTNTRGSVFTVGVGAKIVHREFSHRTDWKRIVRIERSHIVCRNTKTSRLSRIQRKNLSRYVVDG